MIAGSSAAPPLCLAPRPLGPGPHTQLPAGSVDTHFHVFDPRVTLAAGRNYTPHMFTLGDWQAFANAFGVDRGVVVQPSVYGRDNTVLLKALSLSPERLRGVAVVDAGISDTELRRLADAGVRGVRVNTRNPGGLELSDVGRLADRIAPLGWHIQLLVDWRSLGRIEALAAAPVPVVIDHMGLLPVDDSAKLAVAVDTLVRLLDTGNCYVKLSAPYRLTAAPPWRGVAEIVGTLIRSNADQLLWGSDWPHTELFSSMPDDEELVRCMTTWVGDPDTCFQILVTNPAGLYWN